MLTLEIRGGAHNAETSEVSQINIAPFDFLSSDLFEQVQLFARTDEDQIFEEVIKIPFFNGPC
jgi:hypothetical protein